MNARTAAARHAAMLLLASLLAACGMDAGDDGVQQSEQEVSVRLVTAKRQEVVDELLSVGRLVSKTAPTLASEINATVMEVLVEEGDAVETGQPLVMLDTTNTELSRREAQAEIQRLQASIQNEARRVQRYRDLKTRDMMPEERLDDAEAKLAIDRAALEAAEARLAIAEDRLSHATLVSPVDGVVEKRHVSVGDYVKIGGPLMSVTDIRSLQAELPFPETVGADLAPGQVMFLTSPVAPGVEVEVTIETIRPQVGSMSRALVVLASLTNPGPWKPGATIEARVIVDRRPDAVVVPVVALVRRPAGEVVYVLNDPAARRVSERVVTIGQRKNGLVEVTTGLEQGTVVVADGAPYLSDGALVTVREAQP